MTLRRIARRYIPYEPRLRFRLLRRALHDHRTGVRFAQRPSTQGLDFPKLVCRYERPIINYAGQTQFSVGKRHNLVLIASRLNGTVLHPGEEFSVWHLAGRPSVRAGYMEAAAFQNRRLTKDVGGSTCLMSTVLYNVALLGAMRITERHCHSIDLYGDQRYFEIGRDAAIEYGYLDLRFVNPHSFSVLLLVEVLDDHVSASLRSAVAHGFSVEISVDSPVMLPPGEDVQVDPCLTPGERNVLEAGKPGLEVSARRLIRYADGRCIEESLPGSFHHPIAALVAMGPKG